jgi:hypothetical protein
MAPAQPAASPVADDDINNWMAQRWRDVQSLGGQAEAAGRNLWVQATRTGQNLFAPNPSDIPAIGAQFLKVSNRSTGAPSAPAAVQQFVPTPDAPTPDALRQRQAWFKQTQLDPLDKQNSWMAAIALAPTAFLGGDLPAAFGLGNAAEPAVGLTDFPELDTWLTQIEKKLGRPLTETEANNLRRTARLIYERVNGIKASDMGAEVHHSDPLEWSFLKPNADPNRVADLWALERDAHNVATQAWRAFKLGLRGRMPTQAEVMAQKLRIDKMVEPYIVRPGAPRPPPGP